jgi:tetratricopeptide (TPR) repeat protein
MHVHAQTTDSLLQAGLNAARAGRWEKAQVSFNAALREDLRSSRLNFLNALAYDQLARQGHPQYAELARVGYQNASRYGGGRFWAELYLGYLELDRQNFSAAQEAFAAAVREQPQRWEAFYGLGVSSYYSGDVLTSRLAAERCRELAPTEPSVLRLEAFTRAAAGDAEVDAVVAEYMRVGHADPYFARRVGDVLRETRLAQAVQPMPSATPGAVVPADPGVAQAPSAAPASPANQIMVDVVIILSSLLDTTSQGVNLFDGLSFQYGFSNGYAATRASGGTWSSTRSITSTIGVPQLNYSLNLFNDSGQHYEVLARPSLVAYMGRESKFFAGRTINVKVSGVNLGALQPIDVGVGLEVVPESIDGQRVTFHISANRSFLSREEIGRFEESLTTFKQAVAATAEVEFGQTLLLSALAETVRDATFSKVPGLGDVPGVSLFFRQHTDNRRQESLIILLTPSRPLTFATNVPTRPAAVDALIDTWRGVVEPKSDVEEILKRINRSRFFRAPASGDLRWSHVLTRALLDEALRENVALAAM